MKYAICNETFEGWTLERTCELVAELGYQGLELAPFTLAQDPSEMTEADAVRIGDTIRAAGLEPVGLHWLLLAPSGLHWTTTDDAVRARTSQFVQHLARLCGAMGAKVMVWGSPQQRSFPDDQGADSATDNAAAVLREIADVAQGAGVTIALEPLAPRLTNFLTTAAETRRLIERVDHPAIRLHLDVAAMSSESVAIPDLIRDHADLLAHFHANDPNQLGPGFGDVDYRPIAAALESVEFDGYVSVEVFDLTPGPEKIAADSIRYLRECFGETQASAQAAE